MIHKAAKLLRALGSQSMWIDKRNRDPIANSSYDQTQTRMLERS